MRDRFTSGASILFGLMLALSNSGQAQNPTTDQKRVAEQKPQPGAAGEIGNGAGAIGTGVAKGTGHLAKGTAKGAVDLVTLHPLEAGASIGKGAAMAGKDVTVGTVKGTGKIGKGVGKAFKKVF